MYEYIGGLTPAVPGFKVANITPQPTMKFRHFNSSMTTSAGKYVSNWKIAEDGTVTIEVEVPFNGRANIVLPRFSKAGLKVTGLDASEISDEGKVTASAGHYEFSYTPSEDYRCVYSPQTRLLELENDSEVMELLKKELPAAFGVIKSHNKELGNHTLGELPYLFFMGFTPELVNPINEKIFAMRRW